MTPLYIKFVGTQNKIFGKIPYLSYMKKIIKLTESDLTRIVQRVISESVDFISDLNEYKYKRELRSVDEILDDNFKEFITTHNLVVSAFKSFDDFAYQVMYAFVMIPTLYSFNFKGNKTKERKYKELLTQYAIEKYQEQLKEYAIRSNK